ncbi:hypothetical protein [Neisseria musculi]|uniref:Uncharacterized protein n=1 Tax=Neisseria musculi TaxID=1815583 RepID=A0A7H1MAX5_9NEIS|nr:hypothetical protein [Neisseria musculi]QNT58790.1 hypothetical protein H7A79_0733 [Neisseria musculi]
MPRPLKERTQEELLEAAEKLNEQRKTASKKYGDKVLREGGMRVSILLEKKYAELFEVLMVEHGSKKKAFVFLLENYLQPNTIDEK